MLLAVKVVLKDFTENWRVINLIQEKDEQGNLLGPTEEQLLDDLELGLTEQDNIRAFEIWDRRKVKVHKTFAEDLTPENITERFEKLFGTAENTDLDSELVD